jgi:hypothetical protein
MPASLATVSAITKEIYGPKLQKQLNDEVVALKRIQRDSSNIITETGGKYVTFPVHVRRNTGIGARNENEALPPAGQQGYAAARIGLKYLYGAMELSGQTIELVDSNVQAFTSALDSEAERLRVDLALDLNRQVYGTQTGALATFSVITTASTTVNVADSSLFELGELVDIVNLSTGVVNTAGRTINSIPSATTVVISGAAVTTTTAEGFVRSGNWNREWTGFASIVATTGVLHNIDPAVEPAWTANVDSNGGTLRSVSEGLFNTMSDSIKQRGGKSTVIFTSFGVRRAYANLLQQQRQYVNTNGKFDGGYTALAYNTMDGEIPMVVDRMAPKNKAWFINEDTIKLYREFDWKFMQHGGGDVWRLKTTGGNDYDAYTARLVQYSDLGTDRRNTHGLISDLTEN